MSTQEIVLPSQQELYEMEQADIGVVAVTGDGMDSGMCAKRALTAAFKFSGFYYPVQLDDGLCWTDALKKFCRNLGLEVYDSGKVPIDDRPVLAVYQVPDQENSNNVDGYKYHAVFCSDVGPLLRYKLELLIAGWERLMA